MSKRTAEPFDSDGVALKAGDRPVEPAHGDEADEFEDEFEDEFDSEDEIIEAGVDGRSDAEREAEEKRGMWLMLETLCDCLTVIFDLRFADLIQMQWTLTNVPSSLAETNLPLESHYRRIYPHIRCYIR